MEGQAKQARDRALQGVVSAERVEDAFAFWRLAKAFNGRMRIEAADGMRTDHAVRLAQADTGGSKGCANGEIW